MKQFIYTTDGKGGITRGMDVPEGAFVLKKKGAPLLVDTSLPAHEYGEVIRKAHDADIVRRNDPRPINRAYFSRNPSK